MTPLRPEVASDVSVAETQRFVAWVDGVGAYLISVADEISIGGLSGRADVRLAANLMAEHALIRRSGEGYLLEAVGPTLIAREPSPKAPQRGSGRVVEGKTNLTDGDEVVFFRESSGGVRLRFRRVNALASTATLTIASEHRTEPRYDGLVLLGEACLLGPGLDAHVRCRACENNVVLFRRESRLWCRSDGTLSLNGEPTPGSFPIKSGDFIEGGGISFRLEALS